VLSSHERRVWHEMERCQAAAESDQPSARSGHSGRRAEDLPAVVVAGSWISILLILIGITTAGLVVGAAATAAALLWRYWPPARG
jgi:Protein of unknown function (DUF3040)